jgi:tetratricopeptide (TPR) repeat protein
MFILSGSFTVFAQGKDVDEGIKSYENGLYEAAISSLDDGLKDPSQLKDKVLAKAYCYRGLSKVRFLIRARLDMPANMEELGRRYSLTAYEDFKYARKYDPDKKLEEEIAPGLLKLQNVLLDLCGDADKKLQTGTLNKEETKMVAEDLTSYSQPLVEMDKFNYRAYDFLADGLLAQGKAAEALENYKTADSWFFRSAPKSGDLGIGYTYIRIAELEWQLNKDFETAIAALNEGRERIAGEDKKIQSLGNRRPNEKAAFKIMYDEIAGKITKAEDIIKEQAGK